MILTTKMLLLPSITGRAKLKKWAGILYKFYKAKTSKFIKIFYKTSLSLFIQILYNRIEKIQANIIC